MELKTRVDREEALAFLGHRGQELGDLRERLERAACLCEKELVPRGVYREMDASEALALLPGLDIARHVGGCTRVVLLAVTLGTQSEMLLRRERALSATDGLLVDACASSLVEQAANVLDGHIVEEAAARGLAATTRFSPGYGDLGICATAAHLLVPAKSITAVIGLYPGRGFVREGARCSTCPVADSCALRAQGRTCYGNPA